MALEVHERPEAITRSVRGEGPIAIRCPEPGPLWEHVGLVREGASIRRRTALAAAARSRGLVSPVDGTVRDLRDRIAEVSRPEPTTQTRDSLYERLRSLSEQAATLKGQLNGPQTSADDAPLERSPAGRREALIRQLTRIETDRIATEQQLEAVQQQARANRDRLERLMKLEDRLVNRQRDARQYLADRMESAFATAYRNVPGTEGGPSGGDSVATALAIARIGSVRAPIVLACDGFATPSAATDWLRAPVIRVRYGCQSSSLSS